MRITSSEEKRSSQVTCQGNKEKPVVQGRINVYTKMKHTTSQLFSGKGAK